MTETASEPPPGQTVAQEKAPIDLRDANGNGLADGLEGRLQGLGQNEPVEVVVTLTRPAPKAEIENLIGAFDLGHEFQLINGFSGTVTVGQAQALARLPFVFRVEPTYQVTAAMEGTRADTGAELVHATPGLSSLGTGMGVGICFVDSGIMASHEVFDESDIAATCDAIGAASRAETCATGAGSTTADDVGHGTSVAAVAAGDGTGSPYAVALRGIAPDASLYVAKALEADFFGSAVGNDADVEAAVEWCAQQPGVQVINLSVQGDLAQSDGLDSMSLIVNAAVQSGRVVVAGAGNSDVPHTIRPPAAAHLAIVVGAYGEWSDAPDFIAAADALDTARDDGLTVEGDAARAALSQGPYPALFSTRGSAETGRLKPDIVAPGHSIATAAADPGVVVECGNQCYDVVSGTSFATPVVSGIVALMLEADPSLTPDEVRDILYATARDRGFLGLDEVGQRTVPIKDTDWGYGIADAYAAVAQARARVGDGSLDVNSTAPIPGQRLSGLQWVTESADNNNPSKVFIDFEVSPEDAASGMPLAISVTAPLSGVLLPPPDCPIPGLCPDKYIPDIDIWLYRDLPGPSDQELAASLCPGGSSSGECGPYGVHEAIQLAGPFEAGAYRLGIAFLNDLYDASLSSALVKYDITWGAPSSVPQPVVVNQTPVADAGPDQTVTEPTLTLDGTASVDPDGSVIFYTWSWGGGSATGPTPEITLENPGDTAITLTVVDNRDKTDSDVVVVTYDDGSAANEPPTADAGPDQTVADSDGVPGESVTLDGSASTDADGTVETYAWSWSSGGANGVNPSVTLPDGVTVVTLTVTDDGGASAQDTVTVTVEAPPNAPPTASFTSSTSDLTANFTDTSSDGDGSVVSWSWDFGDGNSSTAQNPSHAYAAAGTYSVTLTVTDDDGASDTASQPVSVTAPPTANNPPVADAGDDQAEAVQGKGKDASVLVTLDGSGSSDPDGDTLSYLWTDANGATLGSGATLALDLGKGTYTFNLRVDDGEFEDTDMVCVEIYNKNPSGACAGLDPAPTAGFSFTTSDLSVAFTDASSDSDGSIVSWSWDFGDGNASTAQNPSHTYAAAGTYTVTLTVLDNDGLSDATSQTVMVSESAGSFTLSASGYKVKGVQHVELNWSGAGGSVDVYRDGALVQLNVSGNPYIDNIGEKGGGSYVYQVCQVGSTTCSNDALVTF